MTWKPDYCTLDELKSYQRIPLTDTADDVLLASNITAASRAVDKFCLRQFGLLTAPADRFYTPYRSLGNPQKGPYWYVEIDDLATSTGLVVTTVNGTAVNAANYKLWPRNAIADGLPYTHIEFDTTFSGANWAYLNGNGGFAANNELTITAQWGWATVPAAIHQATMMQATRWSMRRDAPFGIAGSIETGSEMRLLAKLDPDVAVSIRPYYRWWGAY